MVSQIVVCTVAAVGEFGRRNLTLVHVLQFTPIFCLPPISRKHEDDGSEDDLAVAIIVVSIESHPTRE